MHDIHPVPTRWKAAFALLSVLIGVVGARPLPAQDARSAGDDLDDAVDDVFHVWAGPFRTGNDDILPLALVLGTGAAVGVFDVEIRDWIRGHPESLPVRMTRPFRVDETFHDVGRTFVMQGFSALLYLAGHAVGSRDLKDAGLGCAAANVATTLPRTLLSRVPGRMRPLGGRGAYDFQPFTLHDWDRRSLPGGHAANLAACVAFWSNRFELGVLEPALGLLTLTVGFGRMVDDAHWASDTVLGIGWGWAVGRRVASRSLGRLEMAPPESPDGFVIGWRIPM